MAKVLHQLLAMNRGLVSRLALARLDLKRMALSAEVYNNWMPRVMGSMMLRPGLGYIGSTRGNLRAVHAPFVHATNDTAIIELTDGTMRVYIDDVIVTRPAVTSTFNDWNGAAFVSGADSASTMTNGPAVDLWKDNDESGGLSGFATGGYMSLLGNGTAAAIRDRSVAVAGANINVEHALAIVVDRGLVTLRLGSTEGGEEYLTDRTLRPGQHSIALTPSGPFFIRLSNTDYALARVDSVTIGQAAGDMEIPTPWMDADLQSVRWEHAQSGDVMFVACDGIAPKRIERQGATSPRSWSVVDYAPADGPFRPLNTGPVRLKASALTGNIALTAEKPFFRELNVGSLFRLVSAGQQVARLIQAAEVFTDPIRVTGIGVGRNFLIKLTGPTFSATTDVTLQRSAGEPGDWTDVTSYSATQVETYNDLLDNQIIYYRIGVKTGDYTAADELTAKLTFSAGSITGVVRANTFTSSTVMAASVLSDLGQVDEYTADWYEGAWSPRRGFPSSVCLFDGRLFWAGKDFIWGSASDLFDSFDDTVEGDARTIKRSIGSGPVDSINWLLPVLHLLVGGPGAVRVAKASSFDEPLTQTKFGLKPVSDSGTAAMAAARVDTSGIFVSRSTSRVMELSYDGGSYTYVPNDLTAVIPEIGLPGGFTRIGVQRHPDTRIHFVRADGTVCILLFDKIENVTCWVTVTSTGGSGTIEDVVVLPGHPNTPEEDQVYYVVRRNVAGQKRFLEKWALESQAQGAADTRLMDSHITGIGAATTVIAGLSHVEGRSVRLWGNGRDLGAYTVTGGQIAASEAITGPYAVGLPYTARWMSAKLAVASATGNPLTQRKRIDSLAVVLADTHYQGLRFGQSFEVMDDLPLVERGATTPDHQIWTAYDQPSFQVPGEWTSDARLCLRAASPRPCTVLGVVMGVESHDKI